MNDLKEQNELLKNLLKLVIEILPRHSGDCGVYKAHSSYGDTYCDCNLDKLRTLVRAGLSVEIKE